MSKYNPFGVDERQDKPVRPVEEIKVKTDERKSEMPKSATRKVCLMINAKYKITGKYSGQEYFFDGAGARQDVQQIDVDWILSLSRGNVCCGGGTRNGIFSLAEE